MSGYRELVDAARARVAEVSVTEVRDRLGAAVVIDERPSRGEKSGQQHQRERVEPRHA